ncbi:MAG TPA: histidine kinase [Flavobacteriaceae bacterium]|nr:histidine kinase [Flavobacteriaceae bacterium]
MQTLLETLKHPNENGITIFVLGVLFILGIYHFLLYYQHKDKAYLLYSLYVFLVFIGLLNRPTQGFIVNLIQPIKGFLDHISINLIISYNLVYIIFVYVLLDLKDYNKKWYLFYYYAVRIIFLYAIILETLFLITGNLQFVIQGHLPFTISIYLISILLFIPLFKLNSALKYYIIAGTIFLLLTSLAVSIIKRSGLSIQQQEIRYSIFYTGLIIENIFFALALGHKQKNILIERQKSQTRLIKQLQENEKLQKKVEKQLQKDIEAINKQAKIERLEKLQERNNKELAELKLSSLRSQMNPHFIFNSLNSIKRYIIDNKKENAVYYLNKFSKLIRNVLATTREKEISLANEIETLGLYINIENIRFDNQINFNLSVDEDLNLETIKTPSLILQPFIENAIWHGLSHKKENKQLTVSVKKEKKTHIRIEIQDNGIGRKKSSEIKKKKLHKAESIGIKLTEERLVSFSKDFKYNYSLEFIDLYGQDNTAIGTKVVLKIPII